MAQHGTLGGQKTATRARAAAGTQYFTFDGEEAACRREEARKLLAAGGKFCNAA